MKMVLQTLFANSFGQTNAANLTKTNENAFAKAFVADSDDRNNINCNDRQNNARKKRKERKE